VTAPLAELVGVSKRYGRLTAVDDVSLELAAGRTVGVVGESGCGKSTIARLMVGLERPNAGTLRFRGTRYGRTARSLRPIRRSLGMIFQDPYESLDSRFTVGEIVAEPLRIHGVYRSSGVARIRELLSSVGLDGIDLDSYPGEYSGGQRQRIGIARALALDPELVICDEPTSALDVSVQAQILNVLLELQRERGISLLMISHDLQVVRRMSDDVVVMYAGAVMERGPAEIVTAAPLHPYTRALLDAIPGSSPAGRRLSNRPRTSEGIASAATIGCPFATRCPKVQEICRVERPLLTESAHSAACHFPERPRERDAVR
jgi:oligopeptide/dipeptide ABC transporter ATP-binding protein